MSKFVLTAQLQLQAPKNVGAVVKQIQDQLKGVNVKVDASNVATAQSNVKKLASSLNEASKASDRAGKTFATAVRRFSALAIATRAVSLFTNTLSSGFEEAIKFERQLIKISQVTGKTVQQLGFLTNTINKLSTGLGVSSQSLLGVSQILSQAGFSARETEIALKTLAKTDLAPTFDDITQTAEGAVAIFNQFRAGAEALEEQLGAINAVAGKFAVESGDLISVIRRTGGVFRASGGDLNELIALFTSVRATTRESAESIATGLRTIFTRIQRPKTIEFLRQFGVELTDIEGKFVGPFEAVRRLSQALAGLEQGDITFVQVAEELGGFRQIGKVIPLLQQFNIAQDALNVAQKGGTSLTQDAASAQAALAVKITKVKEEFLSLVRGVSESKTFQILASVALNLASALIRVADTLKPILPLITAIAAVKFQQGIGGFLGGIAGGLKGGRGFSGGGVVRGFARGGMVPGSGNRDTVPAMLTPGEFVIKKSSVAKLGAGNLEAMNNNKFAAGGKVDIKVDDGAVGGFFLTPDEGTERNFDLSKGKAVGKKIVNPNVIASIDKKSGPLTDDDLLQSLKPSAKERVFGDVLGKKGKAQVAEVGLTSNTPIQTKIQDPETKKPKIITFNDLGPEAKKRLKEESNIATSVDSVGYQVASLEGQGIGFLPGKDVKQNAEVSSAVSAATQKILKQGVTEGAEKILSLGNFGGVIKLDKNGLSGADRLANDANARASVEGFLFEGIIDAITGANLAGGKEAFDFPFSSISAHREALQSFFTPTGSIGNLINADAKRSYSLKDTIPQKIVGDINTGNTLGYKITKREEAQKFATGGAVGTDTVPALLTPGEFVINKASAQRIGYGSLNRMNKVGKYAKGGVVQRFADGGTAQGGGGFLGLDKTTGSLLGLNTALATLTPTVDENSSALAKMFAGASSSLQGLTNFALAVKTSTSVLGELKQVDIGSFFGKFGKDFSRSFTAGSKGAQFGQDSSKILSTLQQRGVGGRAAKFGAGLGKRFTLLSKNIVPIITKLKAFVGPLSLAAGGISIVSGLVSGFRDLDGQLKEAVKAQDTAKAQSLAVAKATEGAFGGLVAGLASLFGDAGNEFLVGISSFFGGPSVAAIKSNVAAQVAAAKAAESLAKAQKDGSDAMESFSAGAITSTELLERSLAGAGDVFQSRLATEEANKQARAGKSTGLGAFARNIFGLGGLLVETSGQRNKRIEAESEARTEEQKKLEKQQFEAATPAIRAFTKDALESGSSLEEVRAKIRATFPGFEQFAGDLENITRNINFEIYNKKVQEAASAREKAENDYNAAVKSRLAAELEAAEIISEFGGEKLTPQKQRDILLQQSNIGQPGGVAALQTGSAAELTARAAQLEANRVALEKQRAEIEATPLGAERDPKAMADLEAAEKQQAESAKELYTTTKGLIDIKKQELNIIREKNKAEKDAIQALAEGDIAGFEQIQQREGIISRIQAGERVGAGGEFSTQELSGALKELQRLQAAGVQELGGVPIEQLIKDAAIASFESQGIGGAQAEQMAERLAQPSAGEATVQKDIRELAATLPESARLQQEAAEALKESAIKLEAAALAIKPPDIQQPQPGVQNRAMGGLIYASKGKWINFKPKGTDTIPAMLTPGEFVVNRAAVNRGNNLSILQSMNSGSSITAGNSASTFSSGGKVRYRQTGSRYPETGGMAISSVNIDTEALNKFATALQKFNTEMSNNIQSLQNTSIQVKLDTTNVNVNLNGTEFLRRLTEDLQNELMQHVSNEISSYRVGNNGGLVKQFMV